MNLVEDALKSMLSNMLNKFVERDGFDLLKFSLITGNLLFNIKYRSCNSK